MIKSWIEFFIPYTSREGGSISEFPRNTFPVFVDVFCAKLVVIWGGIQLSGAAHVPWRARETCGLVELHPLYQSQFVSLKPSEWRDWRFECFIRIDYGNSLFFYNNNEFPCINLLAFTCSCVSNMFLIWLLNMCFCFHMVWAREEVKHFVN